MEKNQINELQQRVHTRSQGPVIMSSDNNDVQSAQNSNSLWKRLVVTEANKASTPGAGLIQTPERSEFHTQTEIDATTPLGSGINHQLSENYSCENANLILPEVPSVEHIEVKLDHLRRKIRWFGSHFTEKVGWAGELETEAAKLKSIATLISQKCAAHGYSKQLRDTYSVSQDLQKVLEELRKKGSEGDQPIQNPFRTPNPVSTGVISKSTIRMGSRRYNYASGEDDSESATNVSRTQTRPQTHNLLENLKKRIRDLEEKEANLQLRHTETNNYSVSTKREVTELCERVCRLELELPKFTSNYSNSLTALSCAGAKYEEEIATLKAKVNSLTTKLVEVESMIFDNGDLQENSSQYIPNSQLNSQGNLRSQVRDNFTSMQRESRQPKVQQPTGYMSSRATGPVVMDGINMLPAQGPTQCTNNYTGVIVNHRERPTNYPYNYVDSSYLNNVQQNGARHVPNEPATIVNNPAAYQSSNAEHRYPEARNCSNPFIDQPITRDTYEYSNNNFINGNNYGIGTRMQSSRNGNSPNAENYQHSGDRRREGRRSTDQSYEESWVSGEEYLSRRGIRLKRACRNLKKLLFPPVDDKLTKSIVIGIHKSKLPAVDAERKEVMNMLDKYDSEQGQVDIRLVEEAEEVIEDAREWSRGMREKHNELDCSKKSLDKKLFDNAKKFGQDPTVNIYEFLKKFEAETDDQGTAQERATLLYEKCLSNDTKLDLIDRKNSYHLMKKWLIQQFGDIKVIAGNILEPLKKENIPDDNMSGARSTTSYFRLLNSAVKNIQELSKTVDLSQDELERYIYGVDFMEQLVGYIPSRAKFDYFDALRRAGLDYRRIRGEESFTKLAYIIHKHYTIHESSAINDSAIDSNRVRIGMDKKHQPKSKKSAHTTHEVFESTDADGEDDEEEDYNSKVFHSNAKQKDAKQPKSNTAKAQSIKFPCMMQNHNHEIGTCAEFFSCKATIRRKLSFLRNCLTCLGSWEKCKNNCVSRVPDELICKECKDWADQNKKRPVNILLCTFKTHTKPDNKKVIDLLKRHFVAFNQQKLQGDVQLAAHMFVNHVTKCRDCRSKKCKCVPQTLTSKPDPNAKTPIINTCTGKEEEPEESRIVKPSKEDSFYAMQILNLKGTDVLTFYDRGANHHLVNGKLAEALGLKVESDRPVTIGTVGQGKHWTQYGKYSVVLGPTEDNHWFQFSAQGMDHITQEFPQYNLESVNKEVRKLNVLPDKKLVLPKYIGGQEADLLIGINSTGLEPTKVFEIPGGLAIYKSPLKDKFGSRYCYGGPHSIFSTANKNAKSFNHVNAFFTQVTMQYKNSVFPKLAALPEPQVEEMAGLNYIVNVVEKTSAPQGPTHTVAAKDRIKFNTDQESSNESSDEDEECICFLDQDNVFYNKHCVLFSSAVYKAKIPISQRKEYIDFEDQGFIENYRCDKCAKCQKCLSSDRSKMMSLQEKMEQEAISKSVTVNLEEKKVYVDLPFIKPPVEFLRKRHFGEDSNYKQALKIYQTQARKSTLIREAMVNVHKDLVHKGFMKKICDLDPTQQAIIKNAEFRHFMPWRTAEKPDSVSTPYRMVVDASITGLNEILAKGVNTLPKINDILIRNRCRRYVWSTDISKMYNQLHLNDSALPYGLFLFNENLSPDVEPEIYVMLVAWYGVTPTGNQSGEALERLVTLQEEKYPKAKECVVNDRYVDDIFTGDNSSEVMETQIAETKAALSSGGFSLKYCVKSGEIPPEEASHNNETLKILGYNYNPAQDVISSGFSEINFNRKRRGAKKPNPFPVVSQEDVRKLLNSTAITRRMVMSKVAEVWDPCGIWEPFKLQLKLDNSKLNGIDWDMPLDKEVQALWKNRFMQFLEVPQMSVQRCIVPIDAVNPGKLRLLCISDAAELAGGCAIYAGYERTNGSYSCNLITAKSKLMSQKIPRNELEGIKLMAETAWSVRKALGDLVEEAIFVTDSTIAMCWCHNTSKRLRMYTLYRVADIRRLIMATANTSDETPLPLFHIDGRENIADLLTKAHNISPKDLNTDSTWQVGYKWMNLPVSEMPLTTYDQLTISKDVENVVESECFPDPIMSKHTHNDVKVHHISDTQFLHCAGCKPLLGILPLNICYGCLDKFGHCDDCQCGIQFSLFSLKVAQGTQALIDVIYHGWLRSIRVLTNVLQFVSKLRHKVHLSHGIAEMSTCSFCSNSKLTGGSEIEQRKCNEVQAIDYLLRLETSRIKATMNKKKLQEFTEKDGILYYQSRLSEEVSVAQDDLGFDVFYDSTEIKMLLPVVSADSELFFAYAIYIHQKVRLHAGVELSLREINKVMWVINNPRRIIQKIRRDCTKCRIIAKRTIELRMLNHPSARTNITPPFYHCQVDTVFGFKGQLYKKARKSIKIYALVIVCILTGATNILALEGLETQDIVQAIERHSSRHGAPAVMYVDNGTQLMSLENITFSLRNLTFQIQDSMGILIKVSNPKSHEERGRVEARVKFLRTYLKKLTTESEVAMSPLQWETLFAKITNMIDDLPIAKCSSSNVNDPGWEIITPNRLKLGRNNNRSLTGSINIEKAAGPDAMLKRNQEIQKLWYQMFLDRIHHLIPRPKKWGKSDEIQVGDICLFTFKESNMGEDIWKIGRIEGIPKKNQVVISYPGSSNSKGMPKLKTITRCPRNISIISGVNELSLNSSDYFKQLNET